MNTLRTQYDVDNSLNEELSNFKSIYTYNTTTDNAVQAPQYVNMSSVAQGSDDGQRIGRQIIVKYYQLTVRLLPIEASPQSTIGSCFRATLMYDKQSNGSAPPAGTWEVEASDEAPPSPLATPYMTRFIILEDFYIPTSGYEIPVSTLTAGVVKNYMVIKQGPVNLPIIFSSTTGGSSITGRISLCYRDCVTSYYVKWGCTLYYEDI